MRSEIPFVDPEQIASTWRPGTQVAPPTALRALRKKGVLSGGVDEVIRRHRGVLGGRLRLYSSLNRDAARALRSGHRPVAERLAQAASTIEDSEEARHVARVAARARPDRAPTSAAHVLVEAAHIDPAMVASIKVLADRTVAARQKILGDDEPQVFFGTLAERSEAGAVVVQLDRGGERLRLDVDPTWAQHIQHGAPLCLRLERSGTGQVLLSYEEALDLPNDAEALDRTEEPFGRPFDRPLPKPEDAIELPAALLRSAPTIRKPRQIRVAGS